MSVRQMMKMVGPREDLSCQLPAQWERFGASVFRLFGPCTTTIFGRRVPFSQVACATWKDNRLLCLCCPTPRCPSELSDCESMLLLRLHERGGTVALPSRVPSFRASKLPELYVRFQRVRCSTGASLFVFQCRLARVVLIRAILSSDSQST